MAKNEKLSKCVKKGNLGLISCSEKKKRRICLLIRRFCFLALFLRSDGFCFLDGECNGLANKSRQRKESVEKIKECQEEKAASL